MNSNTMTEQIDPELADDRDNDESDVAEVELPDYDPSQFELPDDFEYSEEDDEEDEGEVDGSEE